MGQFDNIPGLDGYRQQVALNQQQDAGQMSKLAQLLQIQDGGMKMQAMQRQLATKELLGNAMKEAYAQSQTPQQPVTDSRPYGGGYSPQVASIFGVPSGQPQQQQPVQQSPSMGIIYLNAARKAGDVDAQEAAMKMILEEKKVAPKFANEPRVVRGPDGKPMLVQMADDGTVRPIQGGYGPAEKLHFADNGQMAGIGMDQYSGKVLAPGVQKMQSPDSVASTASAAAGRAQAERHFQTGMNAPQYMETDAGLMALPKRPVPGVAPVGVPVNGADGAPLGKPLKPIPASVNDALIGNAMSLRTLDKAMRLASGDPVDSAKGDAAATGWKGYLPQSVLNRVDPSGVDTRAEVADIGSLKIHDRSGAAVTVSESPRLMPFIPTATDDKPTVIRKLTRLFEEAKAMQGMLADTYSKDQGYKPLPKLPNPSIFKGGNAAPSAPTSDAIAAEIKRRGL